MCLSGDYIKKALENPGQYHLEPSSVSLHPLGCNEPHAGTLPSFLSGVRLSLCPSVPLVRFRA